jgi:hypothetical protein
MTDKETEIFLDNLVCMECRTNTIEKKIVAFEGKGYYRCFVCKTLFKIVKVVIE